MSINDVKTKYGIVRGTAGGADNTVFKGIPFAKPPVGDLRFCAPEEPDSWEGILDCSSFKDAGIQYRKKRTMQGSVLKMGSRTGEKKMDLNPIKNPIPATFSEDCLYLNIWTPAKSAGEKLPVLVWTFGGGYQWGYTSEMEFDGERLASRGIVVVSVAYRLAAFGFLAHPDLTRAPSSGRK